MMLAYKNGRKIVQNCNTTNLWFTKGFFHNSRFTWDKGVSPSLSSSFSKLLSTQPSTVFYCDNTANFYQPAAKKVIFWSSFQNVGLMFLGLFLAMPERKVKYTNSIENFKRNNFYSTLSYSKCVFIEIVIKNPSGVWTLSKEFPEVKLVILICFLALSN